MLMEDDDDMSLDLNTAPLTDEEYLLAGDDAYSSGDANATSPDSDAMDNIVSTDGAQDASVRSAAAPRTRRPRGGQRRRKNANARRRTSAELLSRLAQHWPAIRDAPWPYADNVYSYFPAFFPPASPNPADWQPGLLPALIDLASVSPGWWRVLALPELENIVLDRIAALRDAEPKVVSADDDAGDSAPPQQQQHSPRHVTPNDVLICTATVAEVTGLRPARWSPSKKDRVRALVAARVTRPRDDLERAQQSEHTLLNRNQSLFHALARKEAEAKEVRKSHAREVEALRAENEKLLAAVRERDGVIKDFGEKILLQKDELEAKGQLLMQRGFAGFAMGGSAPTRRGEGRGAGAPPRSSSPRQPRFGRQ